LADLPLGPQHAAALRAVADPEQREQAGPMRPPGCDRTQPVERKRDLVHALHHFPVLLRLHERRRRRHGGLREIPAPSPPALPSLPLLPPGRGWRGRLLVKFPHRGGLLRVRGRERLRGRRAQRVQVVAVEVERVMRRGGPSGLAPAPAVREGAGSTPVRAHDHGARRVAPRVPWAAREGEGDLGAAAVRVWLGSGRWLRVAADPDLGIGEKAAWLRIFWGTRWRGGSGHSLTRGPICGFWFVRFSRFYCSGRR
jgi:hypothetical protein